MLIKHNKRQASDLGSSAARRESSSLSIRTNTQPFKHRGLGLGPRSEEKVKKVLLHFFYTLGNYAGLVKLVDTLDLGSSIERCGSSSLPSRTIFKKKRSKDTRQRTSLSLSILVCSTYPNVSSVTHRTYDFQDNVATLQ